MSIAIDLRMINSSGIGVYLRHVLPLLIAGEPSEQYCLMGDPTELIAFPWARQDNVKIVELNAPIYSVKEQWEMAAKIPRTVELFWSPHYNVPLFYRGRLVVTVHDICHLAMPQSGLHKKAYARFMFGRLTKKATSIICVSRFTTEELINHTGADKGKIHLIHNGCADKWFTLDKGTSPHPRPYLLFVGNVKPNKNLVSLVNAFDYLKDAIPHDLVIVGKTEGFITGDAGALARARAAGDRVFVAGTVDDKLLERYFTHADALVFPSLYEGFGLPPLEAMACGCPVIASRAASVPEVCGDAAIYCDPYSAQDIAQRS